MPKKPKPLEVVLGPGPAYKLAATHHYREGWTAHLSVMGTREDLAEVQRLNIEIQALPKMPLERQAIEAAHALLKTKGFGERDPRNWLQRASSDR